MTHDELVEEVARLYEDKWGIRDYGLARAAISVARLAIKEECVDAVFEVGDHASASAYANAIRAMEYRMTPDEIAKCIPDEVVEAAARAACATVERENSDVQAVKALGFGSVEEFIERAWPNYASQARAALAAGLAAWPGAEVDGDDDPFDPSGAWDQKHIILPLKGDTDAK